MYKVCVYAICKNESRFVDRWVDAVSEADEIIVLDTGSEDDSAQRLRARGVTVYEEKIVPWRFDTARNRSLDMVPTDCDISVCVDLDEVFTPGWRKEVERAWACGAERLEYRYVWSFYPDGSEDVVFWISKIHARHGFRWVNPVHEVLACDHEVMEAQATGFQLEHHADPEKSRAQYLPLLELAVVEDPHNDRNVHYLGREYMFRGMWRECLQMLRRHVSMPEATWADEKCASYRFMARAHENLGEAAEAERCLYSAVAMAPHLREPWMDMARYYYRIEDWCGVIWSVERALRITARPRTYITEAENWGALPYDLGSLGYYYMGKRDKAAEFARRALEFSPGDERIIANLRFMQS
jgi:glycosyltransferase involved in cell wall biosynthesis